MQVKNARYPPPHARRRCRIVQVVSTIRARAADAQGTRDGVRRRRDRGP